RPPARVASPGRPAGDRGNRPTSDSQDSDGPAGDGHTTDCPASDVPASDGTVGCGAGRPGGTAIGREANRLTTGHPLRAPFAQASPGFIPRRRARAVVHWPEDRCG